jgi:hypothetical protein
MPRAQSSSHLVPVRPWKRDVQNDQRRWVTCCPGDGLRTVSGHFNVQALVLQNALHRQARIRIIVEHEYPLAEAAEVTRCPTTVTRGCAAALECDAETCRGCFCSLHAPANPSGPEF